MYTTTRRRTIARNTRRAARRDARTYRRTYGVTYTATAVRLIGLVVAAGVACIALGMAAVAVGNRLDQTPLHLPTGDTYEYHRTTTCPTEDSCDAWGNPVVP